MAIILKMWNDHIWNSDQEKMYLPQPPTPPPQEGPIMIINIQSRQTANYSSC